MWVGIGAGAVALGPLVGGLLIDAFGWRSVFLINLPVGVAACSRADQHLRDAAACTCVDRFGQVTAITAMGLITAA